MAITPLKIPDRFFGQPLPVAPDVNDIVDKVDELVAAVNAGLATSNAIVGGDKYVQYLSSQTYGVPADASTLNRLSAESILPGNEATVINPHPNPLSKTAPSKYYRATIVPVGTPDAVLVPAFLGSADTVPVVWVEIVSDGSFTPLLASELNLGKATYAGLELRQLLIALVNGIGTGTTTIVTQPPVTALPTVPTAPAAPTAGQVDDLGDVFSFQPTTDYPSFASYKVAGLPQTTGAEWLSPANSYVQNGRVYVRVLGAVPAGGLAVYVGASGSVPDGKPLANNAAFTANNMVPTVPGALAVDFVVDNASLSPTDTLTFTAKVTGGTAPYEHSVQALNPDTGTVTVLGTANSPSYTDTWKVPAGVFLLTDAVTDADGTSLVSVTRRVVVAAPGAGSGTSAPATRTRLGVVRIGDGLSVTEEGLLSAQLYDELGFQTNGAPTNRLLANTFDAAVAKNVLVSTGDSYITAQEAIDNAFPAGVYRDTVALRGYQRGYQLGDNSLIIDGSSASFSADNSILIGLLAGPALAFNHSLVGGNYAGSIIISSHNGGTANKLTLTDLVLSDASSLNFVLNLALANGLIDVVELVRMRGVKTVSTGNPYGNGLINFRGNTYEGHRPIRLNLRGCKLSNLAGPVFTGTAPRGTTIHLYDDTEVSGNSASNLQRVRSADEAGSTIAFTDAELIVDERPATGGPSYTDAQARAAQLGRTAPAGTTLVRLTAEEPTDYGTAASGTFTVDGTNCVVGKEAWFNIGPGGSAPVFINAPSGQPFDTELGKFVPGKFNRYALRVFPDRIEVTNLAS